MNYSMADVKVKRLTQDIHRRNRKKNLDILLQLDDVSMRVVIAEHDPGFPPATEFYGFFKGVSPIELEKFDALVEEARYSAPEKLSELSDYLKRKGYPKEAVLFKYFPWIHKKSSHLLEMPKNELEKIFPIGETPQILSSVDFQILMRRKLGKVGKEVSRKFAEDYELPKLGGGAGAGGAGGAGAAGASRSCRSRRRRSSRRRKRSRRRSSRGRSRRRKSKQGRSRRSSRGRSRRRKSSKRRSSRV